MWCSTPKKTQESMATRALVKVACQMTGEISFNLTGKMEGDLEKNGNVVC